MINITAEKFIKIEVLDGNVPSIRIKVDGSSYEIECRRNVDWRYIYSIWLKLGEYDFYFDSNLESSLTDNPDTVLKYLWDHSQKITREIFPENSEIGDILRNNLGVDLMITRENKKRQVWIPWEILTFENEYSREAFCGYSRNIYRVFHYEGHGIGSNAWNAVNVQSTAFCGYTEVYSVQDEVRILRQYEKANMLNPIHFFGDRGVKPLGRKDLLKIADCNILHISGLISPMRYLDESYIMISPDFWMSAKDFEKNGNLDLEDEHGNDIEFNLAPLVLLNVRDSFARHPRHILEYVDTFIRMQARYVIVSEYPISTQLAHEFARIFYEKLLDENRDVESALTQTKQELIDSYPLVFFYSLYLRTYDTGMQDSNDQIVRKIEDLEEELASRRDNLRLTEKVLIERAGGTVEEQVLFEKEKERIKQLEENIKRLEAIVKEAEK